MRGSCGAWMACMGQTHLLPCHCRHVHTACCVGWGLVCAAHPACGLLSGAHCATVRLSQPVCFCVVNCRGPAASGIVPYMYTYGAPRVGNKVRN